MKPSPLIEWLIRQWSLPLQAVPQVERLLRAEDEGSTAYRLESSLEFSSSHAWSHDGGATAPLVVVRSGEFDYIQSWRMHQAESEIARRLLQMARSDSTPKEESVLRSFFPGAADDDQQMLAAATACRRQLTLVTGGPGTGKTHVLARIIALLESSTSLSLPIRLAAPTGKAADRMKKAVADSLAGLPTSSGVDPVRLRQIAESSCNLHVLLGYNPAKGTCRYHRNNTLPCAALIIDECSMIDVTMWQALLDALPTTAKLILLGDPDQLQSVGQGKVFSDMVCEALQAQSLMRPCHVHLTTARRFANSPDIIKLARALQDNDERAAARLLETNEGDGNGRGGVTWLPMMQGRLSCEKFPTSILQCLKQVAQAASPGAAVEALGKVCILTAQREYFVGSRALSIQIQSFMEKRGKLRNHPVIIDRNDPETGLRNGMVGIIHEDDDGHRSAWFAGGDGILKNYSVARLPEHSPAWAITIHRSQGSEYDNVLVVLPQEESPMATRELLYTAITRARSHVHIAGVIESVRKAVKTPTARVTLLGNALKNASRMV
jgi:exodeoxyribonuclease V alpha subunit